MPNPIDGFICLSLIRNKVEHLLIYLQAIYKSRTMVLPFSCHWRIRAEILRLGSQIYQALLLQLRL